MIKLTETQTNILRAAAERDDRNVLPLPGSLRGGAAAKVIAALLARPGTKQATLIEMLREQSGATIAEICNATGWQAHTVRGAFAGALKKRLGLEVTSEKVDGRGRVYRLPPA